MSGSDLPYMRNERFVNQTIVASPTMTLFLFQMAILVGEPMSASFGKWQNGESVESIHAEYYQ
jgi:hypothetical protein